MKRIGLIAAVLLGMILVWVLNSAPLSAPVDVIGEAAAAPHYVGAKVCRQCHQSEYQKWQESDHAKAMQVAAAETVLGDFANAEVEFHAIKTRFYQQDDSFYIKTLGDKGAPENFKVSYTFGHFPLQQYLIELPNGHIQAFDIAWDSRPQAQGGQRWYHLQPDEGIHAEHPFFWTKHFQNWNSRCADCHSTDVRHHYDSDSHSYDTQWSEINVACEACHGPASEHVKRVKSTGYDAANTGFEMRLANTNQFVFNETDTIAQNVGGSSEAQLNACAACHSRRGVIAPIDVTKPYDDQFSLSMLNEGLYFADGQINDEVFVYGSFLQSKMHQAGVACSNCHDPHTSRLKIEGDGVCLQCHKADVYQAPTHHHHPQDSEGAACVSCHMPERTYMQVDPRRDHSFSIPRPALAEAVGAPNACGSCHKDWTAEQLRSNYEKLYGQEPVSPWAVAMWHGRGQNTLALRSITALANDSTLAPIQRASLMRLLGDFPAQASLDALQQGLTDSSPLVRAAAVESASFLPAQQRLHRLLPLADDTVKSVRVAVANQLAGTGNSAQLHGLFEEYEQTLLLTQDKPSSQINLGSFYQRQGNRLKAKQAYERALFIEPAFVPAMVNLADLYRAEAKDDTAKQYLTNAVAIAPDSAAAQYSLGLLHVRQKRLPQALAALQIAQSLPTAVPHYAYVYAVALESAGEIERAIEVLFTADQRWPSQPDILMTLAIYLDKLADEPRILPVLSRLSRVLPASGDVQALIQKYSQRE